MAALDDVGKAAWRAELAKTYGRHALRPAVQALLADHLAEQGEALAESARTSCHRSCIRLESGYLLIFMCLSPSARITAN